MRGSEFESNVPGTVLQRKLWGGVEIQQTDRLNKNDKAVDVLQEVLRINPGINRISFVEYDPYMPSDLGENPTQSEPLWLSRSITSNDNLRKLSDLVYKNNIQYYKTSEEEAIISRKAIAITSMVKVGWQTLHIPMMDFFRDPNFSEEEALQAMHPYKGAVIKTDSSYHFWGYNLLDPIEHTKFLDRCERIDQDYLEKHNTELVDLGYITASRNIGFSALRIFSYRGTDAEMEPYVVELSKVNNVVKSSSADNLA